MGTHKKITDCKCKEEREKERREQVKKRERYRESIKKQIIISTGTN